VAQRRSWPFHLRGRVRARICTSLDCGAETCRPQEITGTLADFDGDGRLDLYLGGWFWSDGVSDTRYSPPPRDRLFRRATGGGVFADATDGLGLQIDPRTGDNERLGRAAMGVAAGDYDNDADLDVFVGQLRRRAPARPLRRPRALRAAPLLGPGPAVAATRAACASRTWPRPPASTPRPADPSGILEEPPLVIGDECPEEVRGTFPGPISGNSFTPQFADFDNDGDLDLIVGAISHPDYEQTDPTTALRESGRRRTFHFTEEGKARGLQFREDEKHVHWVDLDRDGWLDRGRHRLPRPGDQRPAHLSPVDPQTHGFTLLDAAQSRRGQRPPGERRVPGHRRRRRPGSVPRRGRRAGAPVPQPGRRCTTAASRCVCRPPRPRDATGARVTVETTGGHADAATYQGPQGHYNVQPSRAVYLGLGGDVCALGVTVRWPDGQTQNLGDLSAGADLIVEQGMPPRPRMP
jgi:hypothetical protein